MKEKKGRKLLLIALCLLGWFALAVQFYLIIQNRVASIPETIIRYFSFFTILTNIIVAVCVSMLLFGLKRNTANFFTRPKNITAFAIYITAVGAVYNTILRFLWKPAGFQQFVDELLHTFIPVLFIALWLFFIPKVKMAWISILPWLLYPFFYLIYILIRGHFSSFYPYPFIDVNQLGYYKILINSTGMLLAFLAISLLFVLMNNRFK